MSEPCLLAIYIAPASGSPMLRVEAVEAVAGRGLVGDRYYEGTGHWSRPGLWSEVTLVAQAELKATADDPGAQPIHPALTRRNLLTTGIELTDLIGRTFSIGGVTLEGVRPCDPCGYLERESGIAGLRDALEGRGGLRARIVAGGTLSPGRIGLNP